MSHTILHCVTVQYGVQYTILHCVTLHYAHATRVAHVSRRSNARMPVDCLCQAVPAMTKTRGPPLGCSLQREGACRLVHALRARERADSYTLSARSALFRTHCSLQRAVARHRRQIGLWRAPWPSGDRRIWRSWSGPGPAPRRSWRQPEPSSNGRIWQRQVLDIQGPRGPGRPRILWQGGRQQLRPWTRGRRQ